MAKLVKTELFQIRIDPVAGTMWAGMFAEQPDFQDILEAIELDIEALDEEIEHEAGEIQEFRGCALEVLKHAGLDLFGDVRVADVYLGSISLDTFEYFKPVENLSRHPTLNEEVYAEDAQNQTLSCNRPH